MFLSLLADPDIVSIGGTDTAARMTGSGVEPRLYASKLKMNSKNKKKKKEKERKYNTVLQIKLCVSFFIFSFSLLYANNNVSCHNFHVIVHKDKILKIILLIE